MALADFAQKWPGDAARQRIFVFICGIREHQKPDCPVRQIRPCCRGIDPVNFGMGARLYTWSVVSGWLGSQARCGSESNPHIRIWGKRWRRPPVPSCPANPLRQFLILQCGRHLGFVGGALPPAPRCSSSAVKPGWKFTSGLTPRPVLR